MKSDNLVMGRDVTGALMVEGHLTPQDEIQNNSKHF